MRLADYPFVLVRIACPRCKRAGQYRLARLAAAYGPESSVDTIVDRLTRDCPYRTGGDRRRPKPYEKPCKATLIDLLGSPRPPDLPRSMKAFRVIEGGKGE